MGEKIPKGSAGLSQNSKEAPEMTRFQIEPTDYSDEEKQMIALAEQLVRLFLTKSGYRFDYNDLEDIIGLTMTNILVRIKRYDPRKSNFKTWCNKMAGYGIHHWLRDGRFTLGVRQGKRSSVIYFEDMTGECPAASLADDPCDYATVDAFLTKIDNTQRLIVKELYEGVPKRQIASHFRMTKVQLDDAILSIRENATALFAIG